MGVPLTMRDIIFAAIAAFIITWIITRVFTAFKTMLMRPTQFGYRAEDFHRILKKCYNLFPRGIMKFKGKIYRRGMNVRVKTNQSRTFEGQFIGLNSDNMICLLNKKFVIAQDIRNVEEIVQIKIDSE